MTSSLRDNVLHGEKNKEARTLHNVAEKREVFKDILTIKVIQ